MMRIIFLSFLLICAVANADTSTEAPSHCSNTEQIIFSCQIRDSSKVLSLCASKNLSDKSGYLQYRFGRLNSVELEFPKEREQSQKKFQYRHYFRYQVDETEISFEIDSHKYTIYSSYAGDTEGTPSEAEGVRIDDVDLRCAKNVNANFTPLPGTVPCEEESFWGCK